MLSRLLSHVSSACARAFDLVAHAPARGPPLGRWCHPTAVAYAKQCDPHRKVDLANNDNDGMGEVKPAVKTVAPVERDSVNVLVVDNFGF